MSLNFYKVQRIFTVTIGTIIRVFFLIEGLKRDIMEEIEAAPCPVFINVLDTPAPLVSDKRLDPTMFHFVLKGEKTLWYNSFVPNFL